MFKWLCWKLKIGWVCYMEHVSKYRVTRYWRHKTTGERRITWMPTAALRELLDSTDIVD